MATAVSLDVGFDRTSIQNTGNHKLPSLLCGFTQVGVPGNPIWVSRHITTASDFLITLYDITPDCPENATTIKAMSLSLTIQRSRNKQPADTPFESLRESTDRTPEPLQIPYYEHSIYPEAGTNYSTAFGASFNYWRVLPPVAPKRTYPSDQLLNEPPPNQPRRFSVVAPGAFYSTLQLYVEWTTGQATFRLDPEMIIDNNGTVEPPP